MKRRYTPRIGDEIYCFEQISGRPHRYNPLVVDSFSEHYIDCHDIDIDDPNLSHNFIIPLADFIVDKDEERGQKTVLEEIHKNSPPDKRVEERPEG